jgi:hypothetical protein
MPHFFSFNEDAQVTKLESKIAAANLDQAFKTESRAAYVGLLESFIATHKKV